MIIDCISDLHGYYPKLEGGDLLLFAGDATANDSIQQWDKFFDWFSQQTYRKKIMIGGNHDTVLQQRGVPQYFAFHECEYLLDSGTEFEGFKIWGSPWVKSFNGMNPKAKAFTVDLEIQLSEKWDLIPDDTNILITHSPPFGILDGVRDMAYGFENQYKRRCGSTSLEYRLSEILPVLHIFGHIHEDGGQKETYWDDGDYTSWCINASYVDASYEPVHKPIRIVL